MEGLSNNSIQPQFSKAEGLEGIKELKNTDSTKERIQLGENKVLNLAVKTIGQDSKQSFIGNLLDKSRFVEINGAGADGKKILLNVNSAAKRLGITPKEVRNLAKGDNALKNLEARAEIRSKAIAKYSTAIRGYFINRGEISIGKDTLKSTTLLKMIDKGLSIPENVGKAQHFTIENGDDIHHFFADPGFERLLFVEKEIGSGGFGEVFKTINLLSENKESQAVKTAISDPEDLKNEEAISKVLGNHPGIQSGIRAFTDVLSPNHNMAFYHTELMSGDLDTKGDLLPKFHKLGTEKRLNLCMDLLDGLAHMHKNDIVHGDIKPKNCLGKNDKDGVPEKFVISDFGGAINFNDEKSRNRHNLVSTDTYKPADYYNNSDLKGKIGKSDVFAMSKTVIELLIGKGLNDIMGIEEVTRKNSKNKNEVHVLVKVVEPKSEAEKKINKLLADNNIPPDIAECLIKGLGPSKDRPSAENLFNDYKNLTAGLKEEDKGKIGVEALKIAKKNEESKRMKEQQEMMYKMGF